jgi:hypothetical protein
MTNWSVPTCIIAGSNRHRPNRALIVGATASDMIFAHELVGASSDHASADPLDEQVAIFTPSRLRYGL